MVDSALVVSPLITELAVVMALPPVHVGAATITRNEPSVLGLNATWAVSESGLDADTLRPPALMPANEPNVWPDAPSPLLSTKVSARVAVVPDACADGDLPLHSFTWAVCVLFGSAPVTSTTSCAVSDRTYAVSVMPPPDSCSIPSYGSRKPLKSVAVVSLDSPGITTWPGDLRSGKVSDRLSWAVKPFAAHTAAPSVPLPSGTNCVGSVFAWPSTMSERRTTFGVSTTNDPFCHAVVVPAANPGDAAAGVAAAMTPAVSTGTNRSARMSSVLHQSLMRSVVDEVELFPLADRGPIRDQRRRAGVLGGDEVVVHLP